ncbi:hypothetical protein GIB67_021318 [Kingdonia uniflora]|uniref:AB hydrolase-1 domain-containing protein n=1 Tax=Kingdonia uniflora TaxID=39325 RepID=A0A7J7LY31_9MAGN|nr:hypothetical protein GIB67_021318 [Kingdonia uniflora]
MNFWVPSQTIKNPKNDTKSNTSKPKKAMVVLVHSFATEGIVTWQFQVGSLARKYAVYVPDLLFFGESTTDVSDRSPGFQAECLARALGKLGVDKCILAGFSHGGMVAFKMAERYSELVQSILVSGSILVMTDSISAESLRRLGYSSSSELLLPDSVKGLKALLSVTLYKKL